MKNWRAILIWVVIIGVVVVLGVQVDHALSSGGKAGRPTPTAAPTGQVVGPTPTASAEAVGSLNPVLAGPVALPKDMFLGVLYDTPLPTKATVARWVSDAVRAERWRFYALKTGQMSIENQLMSSAGAGLDFEYGGLFGAENGRAAGITGSPIYTQGWVVTLDTDDISALQGMGMTGTPTYAIILVENGPVTIAVPGQAPQALITTSPRELILAGGVSISSQLGEIWQSDLVLGCNFSSSSELRIQTCTTG